MIKNILENKKLIYAAYGAFFIYLSIVIFYLQFDAYWSAGDDFNYLQTTARGIFRFIKNSGGNRFFPLWGIENNLLLPFGRSFIPYMLLRVALLLGYLWMMFSIIRMYTKSLLAPLFLISLLSITNMFEIYSPAFFQEAFLLPIFSLFIFQLICYESDQKSYRLFIAVLCAILCTYNKEIYFAIFAAYGIFMLIFQARRNRSETLFHLSLIANALVFLALYYYLIYLNYRDAYTSSDIGVFASTLLKFLTYNPLFLFFLSMGLVRAYFFILKKDRRFLLADIFLLMGLALLLGYSKLGAYSNRYTLPVYSLVVTSLCIYFDHFKDHIYNFFSKTGSRKKMLIALGLVMLGIHWGTGFVANFNEITLWLRIRRAAKTDVVFFSKLLNLGYNLRMNDRTLLYFSDVLRVLVSVMYTGGDRYKDNLDAITPFHTPTPEEIMGKTVFIEVPYRNEGINFFTNMEHLHSLGLERVRNIPNVRSEHYILDPHYFLYSSPNNFSEIDLVKQETIRELVGPK